MVVVALSGLPGAGSSTLARHLSQKRNLTYFSAGQLFKDIAQGTVTQQPYYALFKKQCEKHGVALPVEGIAGKPQAALSLWQTEVGKSSHLHEAIEELQQDLVRRGNIVIDGKLSLHFLKEVDLKIWLTGSLKARATRTAERDGITLEEAEDLLVKRQEVQRAEWKRIYGFDYLEQEKEADLIIDTTTKSSEEVLREAEQRLSTLWPRQAQ